MSIERSFEGVSRFLQENDDLIKEIRETASATGTTLKQLADRVESNRKDTEELVKKLQDLPFSVAKDQNIKEKQAQLLVEIEAKKQKVEKYKDDPTMSGLYEGELSNCYLELGKTYIEEAVENIVTFTQDEVGEIRGLLQQATLDAQARQNLANILDAAIKLRALALKVAAKLAL